MNVFCDTQRAEEEAALILKKELGTPEDLQLRIQRLLEACDREEHELQRSMATVLSSQMAKTERARQLLRKSHAHVDTLKADLSAMNEVVQGVDASGAFKHLKQLYAYRQNVANIVEWTRGLKEVQYANCGAELEDGNVLFVFDLAKRVQQIRRQVMGSSGSHLRVQQAVFMPYFEKAEVIVSLLVAKITEIVEQTIDIAIVAAIEEADTAELLLLKDCVEVCGAEMEQPLMTSPAGEVLLRESVIAAAIERGASAYWDENILGDVVDITREVPAVLDGMRKLEAVYVVLHEVLSPLSMRFPIFALVMRALHELVMKTLSRYAEPSAGIESHNLIEAMKFSSVYTNSLHDNALTGYVNEEDLAGVGAELLAAAVDGMRGHMAQLARSCAMTVAKDRPLSLPNGRLYTNGPVDLFTIINQSLAAVTSSADSDVLLKLAGACGAALEAYNAQVRALCELEAWEDKHDGGPVPAPEWQEERMLMLCAYCNDLDALETGLDSVESTFSKLLSQNDALFDDVRQLLPDVGLFLVEEIANHINGVVEVAWKKMFVSDPKDPAGGWFQQKGDANPLLVITATLGEYIRNDLSIFLEESWFVKLCRQLLSCGTAAYLRFFMLALRDAKEKGFQADLWASMIRRDMDVWEGFWSEAMDVGGSSSNSARAVRLSIGAWNAIRRFLSAKDPIDFSMMLSREVLDEFGDCPTFVLQMILEKRSKDLDKQTREKLLATWKERISFQNRDKDTDKPTAGWSQGRSYLGMLEQRSFVVEKHGFFRSKKDPAKEAELEKKKRKEKRKQERAAATAASPGSSPRVTRSSGSRASRNAGDVEVESLAAVLGSA